MQNRTSPLAREDGFPDSNSRQMNRIERFPYYAPSPAFLEGEQQIGSKAREGEKEKSKKKQKRTSGHPLRDLYSKKEAKKTRVGGSAQTR